jgi:penicillin-binding protein 2
VEVKARLFRNYPLGEVGSHLLGYIGRINQREKEKIEENEDLVPNYKGTEYIGKLGVEQSYEADLHGATGFEEIETTAGGRPVRRIRSNSPVPGDTLVMSIDIRLQALLEKLYGDRRGAMVALNPQTGEILAFVSKPTFDPNLFVDGIDYDSWHELRDSIDKPLLNRVVNGTYSPGSTYKPFMALAGLATGKRTPQYAISDPGYYWFGGHKFRDDKEGGHGSVSMYKSIVNSCDTYYYMLAADLGVDLIEENMRPFGFGQITGIDLTGEWRGILPSTEWKQRAYRRPEQKRWYAGETISLGIGQGYNSFTLVQMAHATGVLAAAGRRYKPHLVKEVVDVVNGNKRKIAAAPLESVAIDPAHWAVVHQALIGVNKEGTSAAAFRGAAYVAAGKTGTAQVVGLKANEKYDASKMAEHLLDHALYMAYAPADNPQIALALVVENAGFGAQSAAPIARRAFDYWLQGAYPSEEDIALVQQGKATTPVGPARRAADIPLPGSPEALAAAVLAASTASSASASAQAAAASATQTAASAAAASTAASAP